MKQWIKQYSVMLTMVLVFSVGTAISVSSFIHHIDELREQAENIFKSRHALTKAFIALHRDQVTVMKNLIVKQYESGDTASHRAIQRREYPDMNVSEWNIPGALGTLTMDSKEVLTPALKREIEAVHQTDTQIEVTLQYNRDVAWIYYQSVHNFVYIAPPVNPRQFHFTPDVYHERYWLQAIPKNNPSRRMVIGGPYQDIAGKGWIVTLAYPVYARDTFLGVSALDLRVDTLNTLIRVGAAEGESMMISENNSLMGKESGFACEKLISAPLDGSCRMKWMEDKEGNWWLSAPVVDRELWLVHRLKPMELYIAAARESMGTWVMSFLSLVIVLLLLRLKKALEEVTRITQYDPLTQALNRRGLYDKLPASLAFAQRKHLNVAVMIMDIDFFKKVNDQYGHATGDSVLKQLGGHLLDSIRPFDLVCRWGGEEFVIVVLLDDERGALEAAERIRHNGQKTYIEEEKHITLSGGLTLLQEGESIENAIARADLLLYQAKENGRNRLMSDFG